MEFDKDNPPKAVVFNGIRYNLMGTRRYYLAQYSTNPERKKAKGLHVAIWEHANSAAVPPGHEIHHKDGNTFNCCPENLECLPKDIHRRLPRPKNRSPEHLAHLASIRPLTVEWHRSEDGREWHRQNALRTSKFQPGVPRTPLKPKPPVHCEVCGTLFERVNVRKVVCSASCHGKRQRKRARLQSDG